MPQRKPMTLEAWVRKYALPIIEDMHACEHEANRVEGRHGRGGRAPHPEECFPTLKALRRCPLKEWPE